MHVLRALGRREKGDEGGKSRRRRRCGVLAGDGEPCLRGAVVERELARGTGGVERL